MKTTGLLGIVAMLVLVDVACGGVVFTNRANVNLLNARDVEITANHQASSPNNLRGKGDNYNANWNSGYIGPGKEVITIDFKRVRNIKTIRTYVPGSYGMPTVTVETSGNGIDWTAQSHATSPATNNSSTYTFTLDAAGGVDARWLRITGETYQSDSWSAGNRYIAYMDLRVYGDSGTLASGASLDLVSSSALEGGVTLSQSGWQGWAQAANAVDDNPSVFETYVLYDWNGADSNTVTLTWGQTITFGAFGFHGNPTAARFDTAMHFKLWGATDGTTFTNLLLDVDGGLTLQPMVQYWDLTAPFTGNALKFEIVTAIDAMISDFFAYEVPPAATAGDVVFAIRENVNLMNARDVEITANHSAVGVPNDLRGYGDTFGGKWASGYFNSTNKLKLTMDFKQVRNIKTIRAYSVSYGMPTVTLETSDDGASWTTRSHTTTPAGPSPSVTNTFNHVLDSAVEARWLRITGESYKLVVGLNSYAGFGALRVYGDTGSTLAAGTNLDLVCNGGLDGGVSLGQSGWSGWPEASYIPNDNPADFQQYQALYDWTAPASNTVTLTWGQTFVFDAFGFKGAAGASYFDPAMHFKLWGSMDGGANFTNLLLDVDGGLSTTPMVNYWDLPTPFTGNAFKFEIISASKVTLDDFFAYAAPPPPPPPAGTLIMVE